MTWVREVRAILKSRVKNKRDKMSTYNKEVAQRVGSSPDLPDPSATSKAREEGAGLRGSYGAGGPFKYSFAAALSQGERITRPLTYVGLNWRVFLDQPAQSSDCVGSCA